jgi:hypothetical protein
VVAVPEPLIEKWMQIDALRHLWNHQAVSTNDFVRGVFAIVDTLFTSHGYSIVTQYSAQVEFELVDHPD